MVELACLWLVWVVLNDAGKWRTRENLGDLIIWSAVIGSAVAILFVTPGWVASVMIR